MRYLPRLLLVLLAVARATGGLVSCGKIKAKLERLAGANKPVDTAPQEVPLTPEEERLNKTLEDPSLLDPLVRKEQEDQLRLDN